MMLRLYLSFCLKPISHIGKLCIDTYIVFYLLSTFSGHFHILAAMATEETRESTTFHVCLDQHCGIPPVKLTATP